MNPFTILVVEDDEEARRYFVTLFQDEGFIVSAAENGRQALDRIQKEKPRVLLLDQLLPDIPGHEICKIIKSDPDLRDIILFILSASNELQTKLNCFSNGADEYLTKPVENLELIARVKRFIRMVEEFRGNAAIPDPVSGKQDAIKAFIKTGKDSSSGTVDFGAYNLNDSFARTKPKYGVYVVETLIGSGAMGHVFKAYDPPLERFVAIKILSRKLSNSPEFVARFHREAKVLAAINHPGIAYIYSFGEEQGEHYFAMQWCSGGSLADMIRTKRRIGVLPAVDIMLNCAHALNAAYKKGVVHRDIKPSNLLFDENQQVKIVDFGLATASNMSARITQVQEFLGTPNFMAPEQAQSSAVDHRADVYSLGITFYYMLYGELPFEAQSAIEMVIKHASHPFPEYNDLGGRIPRQVYSIIEKMTQKNPAERYQEYPALVKDLEQVREQLLRQSMWKIPKAENIAPDPSLKSKHVVDIFADIYRQELSGVLTVRWATLQKSFLIREREVILFESSQQDENIWNFLIQKNLLNPSDFPPSGEQMEPSLNRFLLNQTFTMEDFKTSYRELMEGVLMQLFFWPVFEGNFYPATIENDAFAAVRIGHILFEAARGLIDYELIRSAMPRDQFISRTPQFEKTLSLLSLRREESFLASRLDAPNTFNTLHLLTALPEESIYRFIYILEKMGAVQFQSGPEKLSTRKQVEAPAAQETEVQFTPIRETFAPKKADVRQPNSNAKTARKPSREETVAADPPSIPDIIGPKPRGERQSDHHRKVAEQFYRLAREKFDLEDYWGVAQLCKQAIKNNPGESKYYHLMAVSYANHPRYGKDAEQCFYKALEIDPMNPDYHADLASFYSRQGLSRRALKECERALQIAPQHQKAGELYSNLTARTKS